MNQGCLVLIAVFGLANGIGVTLAGILEDGIEGVMAIVVGLAVILASTFLCSMSISRKTFDYLQKRWGSVLDFILR